MTKLTTILQEIQLLPQRTKIVNLWKKIVWNNNIHEPDIWEDLKIYLPKYGAKGMIDWIETAPMNEVMKFYRGLQNLRKKYYLKID